MNSLFEMIGGRKFLACVTALCIAVIFFALGRLSEPAFTELIKWTLLAYIGGNVAEGVAAVFSKPPQPPQA